eukprot:gene8764-6165_t
MRGKRGIHDGTTAIKSASHCTALVMVQFFFPLGMGLCGSAADAKRLKSLNIAAERASDKSQGELRLTLDSLPFRFHRSSHVFGTRWCLLHC